jgi:hypothetical protein
MIQKLLNFIARPGRPKPEQPLEPSPHSDTRLNPTIAVVQDDQTRPSYRIGKHKPEDIYRALDIGG